MTPLVEFSDLQLPQIIIAVAGVIGAIAAAKIAQRGKSQEVAQQAAATALTTPFAQLQEVADEHKEAADKADARARSAEERADRADARTERVRTEWEGRWDRQMTRCRTITDVSTSAITDLIEGRCHVEQAEDILDAIASHNATDHPLDKES